MENPFNRSRSVTVIAIVIQPGALINNSLYYHLFSNCLISSLFNYYVIDYFTDPAWSSLSLPSLSNQVHRSLINHYGHQSLVISHGLNFWILLTKQISNSLTILLFLCSMHLFSPNILDAAWLTLITL